MLTFKNLVYHIQDLPRQDSLTWRARTVEHEAVFSTLRWLVIRFIQSRGHAESNQELNTSLWYQALAAIACPEVYLLSPC